jgi:hypothetical protein
MTMNPLLILGIFTLGAGAGGFCVLLQQRSLRSQFYKEIADQLDEALFGAVRRKKEPHPIDSEPRANNKRRVNKCPPKNLLRKQPVNSNQS